MTEPTLVHPGRSSGRSDSDVETLGNFIGGRWVASSATAFLDVHNPARGTVIARTPLSTGADVDAAVAAAARAFPGWSETPPVVRARALFRFKALLEEHAEELARLVTTEHGKTLDESRGSVRRAIECVEVACGAPSLLMGYGLENVAADIDCTAMRQPIGVCAAIAPFNFPAMVPLWFLPFAVACGNTFVLKPSEQVPLSQRRMFQLLERCDLPPGVVNLVNGGREVVEAICDHPGIRAVSFVGSTPVARLVYRRATHAGKRVQALGGAKNFVIVMPDANFDRSIPVITESFYGCAGERCLAGSVLVPVGEAHGPARERLVEAARALKVGDGMEDGVTQGPLINQDAIEKVERLVEDAKSKGARVLTGGGRHSLGGTFFEPTIIADATSDMLISKEEIFGPVAPLFRFQTEDEAIRMANDTQYGLAAYFYARDVGRAFRVSEALEYGIIGFNEGIISTETAPFGGMKESGIGREGSKYGIEDFVEIKYLLLGGIDG